jgi:hypothetical protein
VAWCQTGSSVGRREETTTARRGYSISDEDAFSVTLEEFTWVDPDNTTFAIMGGGPFCQRTVRSDTACHVGSAATDGCGRFENLHNLNAAISEDEKFHETHSTPIACLIVLFIHGPVVL